jgi:hypothetical protein
MLTTHLLDELERRWESQGAPFVDAMPPGIDDQEIDRFAAPLDFTIPEEVRRWYRWHNGSSGVEIVVSRVFTSLAEDVQQTIDFQEDDERWQQGWLNVMNEKPYIIFDCSGAVDAPVPVWHYDYAFNYPNRPVFGSIGDMVRFWIDLIDAGHMFWNPDIGTWDAREPLPTAIAEMLGGVPDD